MLLVRTDRAALVVGAAITAFFTLEVVRTGLVMTAQTRASVDAWVVMALATGAIYAVLFLLGHHEFRRRKVRARGAYAALGAAAALPPFLLATGWNALAAMVRAGSVSGVIVVPLALGALMGFLYHRRAGYEPDGDDVAALAVVADHGTAASDPDTLRTDGAEYFGGPLVVRSSLGANALASLLGAAALVIALSFGAQAEPDGSPLLQFMAVNGAGKTMLQGMIGLALPIAGLLALAHGVLRAQQRRSYREYAVAGLIGPAVVGVLFSLAGLSWLSLVYFGQFLAPSLVAMLAYRHLAGLEPAPLPADIEVEDRRTLVGHDHVRRRVARVVDVS